MKPKTAQYRGKILFVRDVPENDDRIARWLKQMGYRCVFVDSADEAKKLAEHGDFDAIMYGHEFYLPKSYTRKPRT